MICKNVLLLFFCQYTGGLRPTRDSSGDKPLEWVDVPLVKAAEDGVLERLNSVLESERSLYLLEQSDIREDVKGVRCILDTCSKRE